MRGGSHLPRVGRSGPPAPAPRRPAQWLRVLGFTVPTVSLAILAHLAAGGAPPALGTLAVLFGAVALLSAGLAPREHGLPHLLAGVAGVQVGVHVALLDHHAQVAPASSSSAGTMATGHAVAALLLAWWLRRGEALLWRAAARAMWSLFRDLALPAFPIRAHVPAPSRQTPRSHSTPWLAIPTLRGPPRAS